MKKVSIIGTVGVPARYGGFESLIENIIEYNSPEEIHYTIFCSEKSYSRKLNIYKNARLKYIPLQANGFQSVFYDIISLLRATSESDTIVILGVSGCACLPFYRLFSNKRLIINIDGLEHKREKWGKWVKHFLKFSERMAIKYGNVIISDNKGIQDYVKQEYGVESVLIAYGGDHVLQPISSEEATAVLESYKLTPKEYAFSVCRIEPENNVHVILESFKETGHNLVFVGNWHYSDYGRRLVKCYENYSNIRLLNPIYDLKILNILRSNCNVYVHGHSAGGTNPSLVEAMYFRKPIIAYDVVYNRETTENKAYYFTTVEDLNNLLLSIESHNIIADVMYEIALRRYNWKLIAHQYELLY